MFIYRLFATILKGGRHFMHCVSMNKWISKRTHLGYWKRANICLDSCNFISFLKFHSNFKVGAIEKHHLRIAESFFDNLFIVEIELHGTEPHLASGVAIFIICPVSP